MNLRENGIDATNQNISLWSNFLKCPISFCFYFFINFVLFCFLVTFFPPALGTHHVGSFIAGSLRSIACGILFPHSGI